MDAAFDYNARTPAWLPGSWLLANPQYRLSLERVNNWQAGGASGGYTETVGWSAHFTPGSWAWDLGHTESTTYGAMDDNAMNRTDDTLLHFDLPVLPWLRVRPEVGWNVVRAYDADEQTMALRAAIGSLAALIPGRLNAGFDVTANHRYRMDDTLDRKTLGLGSRLNWKMDLRGAHAPNVSLSVDGRYQVTRDEYAGTNAEYRAYAELNLSWPRG